MWAFKYKSAEFAILLLYFLDKNSIERQVYVLIRCEIHLLKALHANLFIGTNILFLEAFVINIGRKTALIRSCPVTILINIKQQGQFLLKRLLSSQENLVPPCLKAITIFLKVHLPDNCNFLFYPTAQGNLTLYTHILNYNILKILVGNTFNQFFWIFRRNKLGHLLDIAYKIYFFANITHDLAAILLSSYLFSGFSSGISLPPADWSIKTVFQNNIRIYRNNTAVKQITNLMTKYLSI